MLKFYLKKDHIFDYAYIYIYIMLFIIITIYNNFNVYYII